MRTDNLIEESEVNLLHAYNRFPVVLDHGEGVYLYDMEGKKYLDFAAGIAVNALGYHYPGYDEALKEQIDRMIHVSNLYYNQPVIEAGAKLVLASRMKKSLFHQQRHGGHRGSPESGEEICLQPGRSCGTRDHCHESFVPRKNHRGTGSDGKRPLPGALRASDGRCEVRGFQ